MNTTSTSARPPARPARPTTTANQPQTSPGHPATAAAAPSAPPAIRTYAIDPASGKYLGPVVLPPSGLPPIRRERVQVEGIDIDRLLTHMVSAGGSDLHLTTGSVPVTRINGEMQPVPNAPNLPPGAIEAALFPILSPEQKDEFLLHHELDFAYTIDNVSRFRANLSRSSGNAAAVFRAIPWKIRSLEELGMPSLIGDLASLPIGLVLVTGPTGSGKSTTLASIIDKANRTRRGHIVTIEDPIEYVHTHRGCIVNQREVGADTETFAQALKHVLRQDPDIILIGEMRDLETMSAALTAAETGHLVFATLHTKSAQSSVNRIVDNFPSDQQDQVRAQLSTTLKAVVAQTLVPTIDGKGRVAATEIMMVTPAIATMIRRGDEHLIPQALETGSAHGMHTLNQDLARLVSAKVISPKEAEAHSPDRKALANLIGGSSSIIAAPTGNAQLSGAATHGLGVDMGLATPRSEESHG